MKRGSKAEAALTAPAAAPQPTAAGTHRIDYLRIPDIMGADKNPKRHDIAGIKASLREFGFRRPLMVDEQTGRLSLGHGTLQAVTELMRETPGSPPKFVLKAPDGVWLVPVVMGVGSDNAEEAEQYLIADNRHTEAGGWDEAMLAPMLARAATIGASISAIGFPVKEIQAMLRRTVPKLQLPGAVNALAKRSSSTSFAIILECRDEAHQRELLERFARENLECRALT
jgi:ParB-like chromosome segregation protein Spo0J